MPYKLLLCLFLLLASCSKKQSPAAKDLPLIVFSHNLHGELEPCGCRHRPLGGMVQLSGYFHSLKEKFPQRDILFFDTGDSFFPPGHIPKLLKKSHDFAATKVAQTFSNLNMTALVPGDQEFNSGLTFFSQVIKKQKLPILLTNASEDFKIPHLKHLTYEKSHHIIYFIGILSPHTLSSNLKTLVSSPKKAIKKELHNIQSYHSKHHPHKKKILILLSHSGMNKDQQLAKDFPTLNWIIGAHSQSFTQIPRLVNDTRLVQVLSRNHYLGVIDLSQKKPFLAVELNDSFTNQHPNKTWEKRFKTYQNQLKEIKEKELKLVGEDSFPDL